ncbi:hypothetical protein V1517DRAFT_375511 [Lipomyces orientalis]|uniref:Uncharacterized protein n=1 Tax=Lipomyces orientalis TaxID=1233043 RepID=A0ACC3THH7_9ASCO
MIEPHTPGLSSHGYISIAELVVYPIALVITVFNCLRFGVKRGTGWIYLSLFCICRIVASALVIAVEKSSDPSNGLIVAEMIVSSIALTPLTLAALGFLKTSAQLTLGQTMPKVLANLFRLSQLALTAAIILGIVGGVELGNDSTSATGHSLSRASVLLITVVFAVLTAISLYFLFFAPLQSHSRTLVLGVTVSLPFLLVRIIYSLLYAFSSSTANKYSTLTGDWKIYLGMDVIMEFVVLAVLTTTGLVLQKYVRNDTIQLVGPHSAYDMENYK